MIIDFSGDAVVFDPSIIDFAGGGTGTAAAAASTGPTEVRDLPAQDDTTVYLPAGVNDGNQPL